MAPVPSNQGGAELVILTLDPARLRCQRSPPVGNAAPAEAGALKITRWLNSRCNRPHSGAGGNAGVRGDGRHDHGPAVVHDAVGRVPTPDGYEGPLGRRTGIILLLAASATPITRCAFVAFKRQPSGRAKQLGDFCWPPAFHDGYVTGPYGEYSSGRTCDRHSTTQSPLSSNSLTRAAKSA